MIADTLAGKKDLNKTSEVEDDYDISNNFENFWD